MNCKKTMKSIMRELAGFKSEVDALATSYQAERKKFEEELKNMENKYTQSYIDEYRRSWEPKVDYNKSINTAREKHQKAACVYLDKIEAELERYFQVPVDSGFAATVTAVKSLGVTLNNREFEVLQSASNGYWARRLLNELGVSRTKSERCTVIEGGDPKNIEEKKKIPYLDVQLPNIDEIFGSLQNVRNSVNTAFEAYCGKGYVLKNIVFPLSKTIEESDAKFVAVYGVQPPKKPQALDDLTISRIVNSERCFDKNYTSYTEFAKMIDSLESTIPKSKKKEYLTAEDKELIDAMIDSHYETLAKKKAVQIAKIDERLRELLVLDSRYGATIRQALGEAEENE